jgi:hypothetical protein
MQWLCLHISGGKTYAHNARQATYRDITERHIK